MDAIRSSIDGPFAEAIERVKAGFAAKGFGTLAEINISNTVREKVGADLEPYTVLQVCNPNLAVRAIGAEHEVGVYMPCTVLVHQCGGRVNVATQPPEQVVQNTGNEALRPILAEVRQVIEAVFADLK